MFTNILLCSHGSPGAQKAEDYVFETLLPQSPQAAVTVLAIIDKDWSVMTGDDWLNTSKARNEFIQYVDDQLGREIAEDWQRIKDRHPLAQKAKFIKVVGEIEQTITDVAQQLSSELIVLGAYQKKPLRLTSTTMSPGLAARITNKKLHPILPCPLLVIP